MRWQSLTELDEEYGMHRDLRLVRMQYKRTRGKENPMPKEERRKEERDGREGDSRTLNLLNHETLGSLGLGVRWHVKISVQKVQLCAPL